MPTKKTTEPDGLDIRPLEQGEVTLRLVGTTPLIQNRMSEKVKQTLLVGGKKKSAADKAAIKHDPIAEFRAAVETVPDGPTAIGLRSVAIKAAMADAAVETAGVYRTSMLRLLSVYGEHVPVWGIPALRMDVTRSADQARTPDVRTRPMLEQWCCEVTVHFITPQLNIGTVAALAINAGMIIGVGDYRQQKGKGNYGSFRVLGPDDQDDEWDMLTATAGREAQLAALANPEYAGPDTEALMQHYIGELHRRIA